jgi:hypothetical protein
MLGFSLSPGVSAGVPDPLAPYFARSGGTAVAIAEARGGALSVWSELGNGHAVWMTLDNDDPTQRMSWRETLLAKLRNVYPVRSLTLTGSWSQLQTSGSGLAGSYTGNRAVSTSSTGATAQVTVEGAGIYDLWVHYTGRTSGGYARVLIDGTQDLVNEIGDPAELGFKAFPTYAPVDLTRRQVVRVASGLTGSHEITLSAGGSATPGGNAIMIEAISVSAGLAGNRILPPMWQAGTAYTMGDEVQWQGTFYAARATGLSGATPPTHSNGIGSDGALDWRADNRPTYPEFVAIDYASEREYAVRFSIAGVVSEVGGQTHGNEPLVQRTITLDGLPWVPSQVGTGLSSGTELAIVEQTVWQTASAVQVATCTLERTITAGEVRHVVTVTPTGPQADVEWFYPGMLPMVHWDGESGSTVATKVVGRDAVEVLADYAGQTPTNRDLGRDGRIGFAAQIGTTDLRYGLAVSVDTGGLTNGADCFLLANTDGRTASGSLDWTAKAYVKAVAPGGWSFAEGDAIAFGSRHVMSVR